MADSDDKTIILESERDEVIKDHNYDGILELSRSMPWWLTVIFFSTVTVGIIYMLHKFSGSDMNQSQYLEAEMAQIKIQQLRGDKNSGAADTNMNEAALIDDGKKAFSSKCAACHGANAEGTIGPNLTDDYWIHGKGTPEDIKLTINNGVPEKGMPPWAQILSPQEVNRLVSYIRSLAGTNAPNGKAAQGTLVNAAKKSGG